MARRGRSLGAVTAAAVARRAATGGLLGLLAGLALGTLDGVLAARAAQSPLASPRFVAWVALSVTLALTALGLLQGLIAAALRRLARRLAGVPAHRLGSLAATARGTETPPPEIHREVWRWFGRLVAIGSLPAVAWLSSQVFAGPRAQRIPGHHALALLLGLLTLGAVHGAIQVALRARAWVQGALLLRGRLGRAALAALVCAGVAVVLVVLDRRVLPRLYPWFHGLLAVLAVAVAQTGVMLLGAALGPARPVADAGPGPGTGQGQAPGSGRRRRFLSPATIAALGLVVLGLGAGGLGLVRLVRAQVLRGLALEHTTLCVYVLRAEAALHRRAPATTPQVPPPPAGTEAPAPVWTGARLTGRDVFLITVDALRADRLRPDVMPFTSRLADQGVRFDRAYTQVPHTSFAVATLLTGKPVHALLTLGQDAASHETLPTILRRFRYKTAAFYPPSVFFVERERLKALEDAAYGFEYVKFEYLTGARRTDQVLRFLGEENPQRTFVWVHYLEPHEPYDAHPGGPAASDPDRERYDGEVRYVDREIERLVGHVQRTRPGALVIVAADHGEEFGEHGGRYHGTSLYEEQAHVPLFMTELPPVAAKEPAGAPPLLAPRRLGQPVGLIDVAPTLLGLLDIERSARMRGRDLSPWLLSGATVLPEWPVFSEIGRKKLVVLGARKLICDFAVDSCRSFDLARDPAERTDLSDAEPGEVRRLRAELDRFIAEARRFEQAPVGGGAGGAGRAGVLARARMGDRAALPGLVHLLGDASAAPGERREAVTQLAQLVAAAVPATPGAPDPLRQDAALFALLRDAETIRLVRRELEAPAGSDEGANKDPEAARARRWAAIALVRLLGLEGRAERAAGEAVVALLRDAGEPEQKLAAALVLRQSPLCGGPAEAGARADAGVLPDCAGLLMGALPPVLGPGGVDDPDRVRALVLAVGATRDPRAVAALSAQLGVVRSRADVVRALGETGQAAAAGELAPLLLRDPYVTVRAAAAAALGRLGGAAAREALTQAQAGEREAQVLDEIRAALGKPHP